MKFRPLPPATVYVSTHGSGLAVNMDGRWNEMIVVAVMAGVTLGMDMVLLIAATATYIKRRKAFMGTPAFFILALISGFNLLVLCVVQLNYMKTTMANAVLPQVYSRFIIQFASEPMTMMLEAFGLEITYSSFRSHGYAISQVEIIIPIIVDMVVLTRLLALFPDQKRVRSAVILLMTVSGANAFLSIGLRILSNEILLLYVDKTLADILYTQHFWYGSLSFGTNAFATWLLISKWRSIKCLETTKVTYYATRRPNHAQRRLAFLIIAGFLRGIAQLSYCIIGTVYGVLSLTESLPRLKLAFIIEFVNYSISALYPIASYVFLHAVHRDQDICHLDPLNFQGDQGRDIPLDDLDIQHHESTVRNHGNQLINLEEAAVDPLQTDARHAE